MKKGQLTGQLGKLLLAVALLLVLVLIVIAFSQKNIDLFEKVKEVLTFGN